MLITIFSLILALIFGLISFLLLKDVIRTTLNKCRRSKCHTVLSRKEIALHIALGAVSAIICLLMLAAFIADVFDPLSPPVDAEKAVFLNILIRSNHP